MVARHYRGIEEHEMKEEHEMEKGHEMRWVGRGVGRRPFTGVKIDIDIWRCKGSAG